MELMFLHFRENKSTSPFFKEPFFEEHFLRYVVQQSMWVQLHPTDFPIDHSYFMLKIMMDIKENTSFSKPHFLKMKKKFIENSEMSRKNL